MEHSFELLFHLFSCFLITKGGTDDISVVGSIVELKCQYQATSSQMLSWVKAPLIAFSSNDEIYLNSYPDIKRRVTITGNHVLGEYHLSISDVKKTDAGTYECAVGSEREVHHLTVIEGPKSVSIVGKTQHNTLVGTEGLDLTISCTAVGGDPAPDMVLQIRNQNITTKSSARTIQYIIPKVGRSSDGGAVTCLAGYQSISFFSVKDTATVYLYLKPSIQSLSPDPVVTVETKPLSVTCISAGGRPKPTVKWTIDNVDITTHSTEVSSTHDTVTDTHAVMSTLSYSVDKIYNGKTLSCGFKNGATGNSYVSMSRNLDVKFSPSVSVDNKTFNPSDISRQISCAALGNPANYTYVNWQHKSKYDKLIRILDKSSTLTLPSVSEEKKYQDTGEYICAVSNGIKDKNGNINQQGSGFVTSQAPPVYLSGLSQIKFGQLSGDVQIQVIVYSVPKYSFQRWFKGSRGILSSSKYIMTDVPDVMTDTFHGTNVQVDGYKLTLTIHDLEVEDFVNYTLSLANGVGQTVEHLVVLMSAGPPVTPANFTITCSTDSTVTLHWISAFDGGHDLTFYMEYRKILSNIWKTATVPKESITLLDEFQSFELPGLEESSSYEIRMYAENRFNRSLPTHTEQISTKGKNCDVECYTVTVAVGLSVVTVISLVVNGILSYVIMTGKQKSKQTTQYHYRTDKESNPEVYYNIADKEDDKTDLEPSNYETLGTKDKPNLYDDLRKTTRDTKSKLYSNTMI